MTQSLTHCPVFGDHRRDDEVILPPTDKEVRDLVANAADHLKRAIFISAFTGLRPGAVEMLSMKWHQIDWEKEQITVISARKGGVSSRVVPAFPTLLEKLKIWKEEDDKKWPNDEKENPEGPQEYIIHFNKSPKEKGKPISSIKTAWATAKRKAKITRRLRPYDLRHAFATRLLEEDADLKATSELLGHSRPDTTMRFYQHVTKALHRASINKLKWNLEKKEE